MIEITDKLLLVELKKLMALKERAALLMEQGLPAAFRQSGLDPDEKLDVLEQFRRTAGRQREHLHLVRELSDDIRNGGIRVH